MKKVVMGILAISLGLVGSVSAAELVDNLIGYWPLDGDGTDASIFGNDGTVVGSPYVGGVTDANSVLNQALGFDGSQHVEIANQSEFDIADHITMSAWILVDVFDTDWQTFFGRGDWSWRMARNGGGSADPEEIAFHMSAPGGGNMGDWGPEGVTDVVDGQWHHVVGVWPGTGQPAEIYIDGVFDSASPALNGSIQTAAQAGLSDPVTIGAQIHNAELRRHFKGMVDEVAIWDRALTVNEIAALYNSGNAVSIVDWRNTEPIVPADGATGIIVDPCVVLEWTAGTGMTILSHNVYVGTDKDAVDNATTASPEYLGNTTATKWKISGLTQDAVYYWRADGCSTVDINEPNDCAKGPIWSFDADFRPEITLHPANLFILVGATAQFTVAANDAVSYQWFGPSGMLSDGGDISGVTTTTLTILNADGTDEGNYYCAVTNTYGTSTSNNGQLALKKMLGYWPFDGDPCDYSGFGNHAVAVDDGTPPASYYDTGIVGSQAALFNDHYLWQVPNPTHFDQANASITVSCWVKASGMGNWEPFVSKRGEGGEGWQLRRQGGNNAPTFTLRGTSGPDDPLPPNSPALLDNQWHFLAGTYDGSTRVLYMDGVPIDTQLNDTSSIAFTDQVVAIGGRYQDGSPQNYMNNNGLIDDVKILNYAMTAVEVATEYFNITGTPVCYPPLTADITGPQGVPDCVVNIWDFATIAANHLLCNLIPDDNCP